MADQPVMGEVIIQCVSLDFARGRRSLLGWVQIAWEDVFSCVGRVWVVPCRRVGGLSQGQWVFRGWTVRWSRSYLNAARMCCQAVAICDAHRQVASIRNRSWRALRVMRAAVCRTR
jgi:hypothetical protein